MYKESVFANKTKLGAEAAIRLAHEVSRVLVARRGGGAGAAHADGRANIIAIDMKKDPPSDAELLAVMLGPTGNLRAPVVRRGSTLLVGFTEEMYREVFD